MITKEKVKGARNKKTKRKGHKRKSPRLESESEVEEQNDDDNFILPQGIPILYCNCILLIT